MKVKDIMTRDVATVGQRASLKQVARVMTDRGVSGVPVVNAENHVLGVVTEGDILAKAASHPESLGMLGSIFRLPTVDERHRAAETAGEAMTPLPVTIDAESTVPEAARLMVVHRVNRLPVLRDGKLSWESSVAPISSARSLVPTATFGKSFGTTSSDGLLWLDPDELDIDVSGGVVRIGGTVEWRTVAQLVEAFAWRIPGVVSVDCSELRWRTDDRKQRTAVVSQ